jgi:hypothetical protein
MPASRAALDVSCMFATGACRGTIVLRSAKPVRAQPGRKARVVELRRLGRVGAIAVVTVRDDAGNTGDDTVKLTLTR